MAHIVRVKGQDRMAHLVSGTGGKWHICEGGGVKMAHLLIVME